jgi:hypothetical protein
MEIAQIHSFAQPITHVSVHDSWPFSAKQNTTLSATTFRDNICFHDDKFLSKYNGKASACKYGSSLPEYQFGIKESSVAVKATSY